MAPGVTVLRPVVHGDEQTSRPETLDERVEQRLRFGVDPVEVFEDQHHRLGVRLAQDQAAQGFERRLATLRRREGEEWMVVGKRVQQTEDCGNDVLQRLVEGEERAGHLGPDRPRVVTVVDLEMRLEHLDDR